MKGMALEDFLRVLERVLLGKFLFYYYPYMKLILFFSFNVYSVVSKPLIGVFDLATNLSEGIRNTTTVFDKELEKIRLPRFVSRDGAFEELISCTISNLEQGRGARRCGQS